jgi:hypothetical protein
MAKWKKNQTILNLKQNNELNILNKLDKLI